MVYAIITTVIIITLLTSRAASKAHQNVDIKAKVFTEECAAHGHVTVLIKIYTLMIIISPPVHVSYCNTS